MNGVANLVDFIEGRLEQVDVTHGRRLIASLSLSLCRLLQDSLTLSEGDAVDAASAYLDSGDARAADKWIGAFAKRIGGPYPVGMERKVIARERLVWCALNRVTNLDGYAVEFVLGVAEKAGVTFDQMLSVTKSVLGPVIGTSGWPGDQEAS